MKTLAPCADDGAVKCFWYHMMPAYAAGLSGVLNLGECGTSTNPHAVSTKALASAPVTSPRLKRQSVSKFRSERVAVVDASVTITASAGTLASRGGARSGAAASGWFEPPAEDPVEPPAEDPVEPPAD